MQVNLPKVKLQYRQELQEALTSMGESLMELQGDTLLMLCSFKTTKTQ